VNAAGRERQRPAGMGRNQNHRTAASLGRDRRGVASFRCWRGRHVRRPKVLRQRVGMGRTAHVVRQCGAAWGAGRGGAPRHTTTERWGVGRRAAGWKRSVRVVSVRWGCAVSGNAVVRRNRKSPRPRGNARIRNPQVEGEENVAAAATAGSPPRPRMQQCPPRPVAGPAWQRWGWEWGWGYARQSPTVGGEL